MSGRCNKNGLVATQLCACFQKRTVHLNAHKGTNSCTAIGNLLGALFLEAAHAILNALILKSAFALANARTTVVLTCGSFGPTPGVAAGGFARMAGDPMGSRVILSLQHERAGVQSNLAHA